MKVLPQHVMSAISSIQWSLSKPSNPMYYEPLDKLETLRVSESVSTTMKPILERGISNTIDDLLLPNSDDYDVVSRHNIMIALGLVCLGNGLVDEAHNLITPLSWKDETHFGGPTLLSSSTAVDDSVVSMASYAHSLLHRKEGFSRGEFGMIGYQNANFWARATHSRGDQCCSVPYKDIRENVLRISHQYGTTGKVKDWCQDHIIDEGGIDDEYWEMRALHQLCATVSSNDGDDELQEFAEKAAEVELRVLMKICFERAGYTIDNLITSVLTDQNNQSSGTDSSNITIEKDLAQSIGNKVSSAHIGGFQSSNYVTLRRVLQSRDLNDISSDEDAKQKSLSAAAGVACRLMDSPAIKLHSSPLQTNNDHVSNDGDCVVHIIIPTRELDHKQCIHEMHKNNDAKLTNCKSLALGDAFAFLDETGNNKLLQERQYTTNGCVYSFVPCDSLDENVVFCDRFFGSRGHCPTTVLQWSKGTIHRST